MRAGRLRPKVEIQNPTWATDAQGGQTATWATVDKSWAAIEPISQKDRWNSSQNQVWGSHTVTVRYTPTITMASRLVHNGRILNIVSIANVDERNREMQLQCAEEI
jgi:SPP1 family predicted phage head-tail adaptor